MLEENEEAFNDTKSALNSREPKVAEGRVSAAAELFVYDAATLTIVTVQHSKNCETFSLLLCLHRFFLKAPALLSSCFLWKRLLVKASLLPVFILQHL
ncbi:Hypothetical predicted protein [Podarcis lilfordi]|uniref:Uncharacterized protein n=1 Tax=Podarcis lilfordi TaxID=74358 RepID=A0AA35P0N7_9SAUR|nr:Hypothetical predicted protein [Podarcis lilfordi]